MTDYLAVAEQDKTVEKKAATLDEVTTRKRCQRCAKTKPLSEYGHHAKTKDGYRKMCKVCVSERMAEGAQKRATNKKKLKRVNAQPKHNPGQNNSIPLEQAILIKALNSSKPKAYIEVALDLMRRTEK